MDINPQNTLSNKNKQFFHTILKLNNTIYTDQIGKFAVRSIRGYSYILITYCYNSTAILARPLRSKKGIELLDTIKSMHSYLSLREFKLNYQILDNEASTSVKTYLKTSLNSL